MEQAALLQYTFVTGFILGGFSAAQRASVQFLAEHQHETLRKRSEFVAFHRARNYRLMAAFGTGGVRRGAQLAAVAAAYLATKEGINWMRMRGRLAFPAFLDNLIACSVLGGAVFAVGSTSVALGNLFFTCIYNYINVYVYSYISFRRQLSKILSFPTWCSTWFPLGFDHFVAASGQNSFGIKKNLLLLLLISKFKVLHGWPHGLLPDVPSRP